MSSTQPPAQPPEPPNKPQHPPAEILEQGSGAPLAPQQPRARGGRRKGLLIGGGVAVLALAGGATWAALSFFATGPQPAEALPDDVLFYASVDLDPSGGQKIEALRTLNKFPLFEDKVGINEDDDLAQEVFELVRDAAGCDDLEWDQVDPWLGNRAAVAALPGTDGDDETPVPAFAIQVDDTDAADDGLADLKACGGEDAELGWSISGDWAILAQTDEIADDIADRAADGSLADDEDFQHWTGEAGDSGVAAFYAAPDLGPVLADNLGAVLGITGGVPSSVDGSGSFAPIEPEELPDEVTEQLADFAGAAGVIRFDDGALELEVATDAETAGGGALSMSDTGGDAAASFPADTAAVLGIGFADGWFDDAMKYLASSMGGSEDVDAAVDQLAAELGLDLPEDAETLFGDSAALGVGPDLDPDLLINSEDGSDVPIAVKVEGDADEVEDVLDKLRAAIGPGGEQVLGSDSDDDTVVVGPNADYREEVLEDGDLGDSDVFRDVVAEVDGAGYLLFVNVNELEDVVAELASGEDEVIENLEPLSGLGISAWVDGDVGHSVLRLATD
ncbi:DUF3352 domain-containing protein [Nocardioides sp. SYSU D00038]|uniref:DUF3352 domain-containing protein n=1 Tax=Nocardioides sp. SYSU D00038 TaxID=2812554 RepID=UPI001968106A|nr:DUF3352 domain-containing protein [Nocardioides sp. SYSU D00038]